MGWKEKVSGLFLCFTGTLRGEKGEKKKEKKWHWWFGGKGVKLGGGVQT